MKVLALVTEAFGGRGGIAQYNRDLLTALGSLPIVESVTVLPRFGASEELPRSVEQCQPRFGRFAYAWSALVRARRLRPDVLFCGHLFMLPLAIAIGALIRRPVWLQIHGTDAWERPSPLSDRLVTRAALVTSVSRYTRKRFLSWARVSPSRVRVLPNTVGEEFQPGDRAGTRRRMGLAGRLVLLTVGRLAASEGYKGHERVLRCLSELRRAYPNLSYLIAGEGDDKARLQQLAEDLGVAGVVSFLGQVEDRQLLELYGAADLFVMPSTGEGFGIVFLEAMACGTPALGLNQDGSTDPLRDGDLGPVVAETDLCDSIKMSLANERPVGLSAEVREIFGTLAFRDQLDFIVTEGLCAPVVRPAR